MEPREKEAIDQIADMLGLARDVELSEIVDAVRVLKAQAVHLESKIASLPTWSPSSFFTAAKLPLGSWEQRRLEDICRGARLCHAWLTELMHSEKKEA